MPKILCPYCNSLVSSGEAHSTCPWCGEPLAGVAPLFAREDQFVVSPWLKPHELACAVILALLACGLVIEGLKFSEPAVTDRKTELVAAALATCQKRIAASGKYDSVPVPPPAKNYGTPGNFYFVWPKGSFQVMNDEGTQLPASATCRGHLDTGLITELSLNGKESR